MTEYTTDSHLNANCISIAEELEAHANGRAYEDEEFWSSADLTGNQTCGDAVRPRSGFGAVPI